MDTAVSVKARSGSVIDLGQAHAFACGDVAVDPPARQLKGQSRAVMLEPRMMQLLVALWEVDGAVVARERLIERCWGNVVVGDDSLNRAIAGLRRGLAECGTQAVAVQTVPRVGYRLVVEEAGLPAGGDAEAAAPQAGSADRTRRRLLAGLGMVGIVGAVGAGAVALLRREADDLSGADLAAARRLLLDDRTGTEGDARALLERMVTAAPGDARGWGLLAVAWQRIGATTVAETISEAERQAREAAGRALALERLQGDAQAALALLDPAFGGWMAAEERLQRVLEVVPDNDFAQQGLVKLLMGVGRLTEALQLAETAGARHPDSVAIRSARIQLAWADKGPAQALRVADALGPAGLEVAVVPWLLALSGRHAEGEALVAGIEARQAVPSRVLTAQRLTARALGTGTDEARAAARDALIPLGAVGGLANYMAIGGLSGLGFVDDAFALADRWYRAALAGSESAEARVRRHRTSARILFLPITEAMRADARFVPLCERIGLVGYWRQRGLRADALKDRLLPL